MTTKVAVAIICSLCTVLTACSDSQHLVQIQAACDKGGKFSEEDCRCIAEGAADVDMPEQVTEWLTKQLEAAEGTPIVESISPKMKTRDYLRFMDRVKDPQRFCER